jgi:hypothetical protein
VISKFSSGSPGRQVIINLNLNIEPGEYTVSILVFEDYIAIVFINFYDWAHRLNFLNFYVRNKKEI